MGCRNPLPWTFSGSPLQILSDTRNLVTGQTTTTFGELNPRYKFYQKFPEIEKGVLMSYK